MSVSSPIEIITDEEYTKLSESFYSFILFKLLGISLSLVFLVVIITCNMNFSFSLIPMFLSNILSFIIFTYKNKDSKKIIIFSISSELLLDILFLIVLFSFYNIGIYWIILFFPGTIQLTLNFFSFFLKKKRKMIFLPNFLIVNSSFYLTFLLIMMKYNYILDCEMNICFIPFYLFLTLLLIGLSVRLKVFCDNFVKVITCQLSVIEFFRESYEFLTCLVYIVTHYLASSIVSKYAFQLTSPDFTFQRFEICVVLLFFYSIEILLLVICKAKILLIITQILKVFNNYIDNLGTNNTSIEVPEFNLSRKNIDEVTLKKAIYRYISEVYPTYIELKNGCYYKLEKEADFFEIEVLNSEVKSVRNKKTDISVFQTNISKDQENRQLQKSISCIEYSLVIPEKKMICYICYDKNADSVYMDCSHGGMCYDCCIKNWRTKLECHICRKKILEVIRVQPCLNYHNKFKIISFTFSKFHGNTEFILSKYNDCNTNDKLQENSENLMKFEIILLDF